MIKNWRRRSILKGVTSLLWHHRLCVWRSLSARLFSSSWWQGIRADWWQWVDIQFDSWCLTQQQQQQEQKGWSGVSGQSVHTMLHNVSSDHAAHSVKHWWPSFTSYNFEQKSAVHHEPTRETLYSYHIFTKYWPILTMVFHWHSLWNLQQNNC